jgi:hypothetical protein
MVRTQIQLEERQVASLQELSAVRKQYVAELIRQSVDLFVERESGVNTASRIARAKSVVGKFASSSSDGSRLHDDHLADAFATGR